MRLKITSALVLHLFIKISLRRMFSRSVSGRPLRKPNNFCISPLVSDRLFKASISLSVKRCLGYLPSNPLTCVCACGQSAKGCIFRYLLMKLWRKPYYQAARVFRCFLFYIFLIHTKYCFYKSVQPNTSLRAFKKSIGIRTNEVRLYDIGISCIALLSEFTHKHATHWGCTCSQTCCITVLKLPKQQQLWSVLRFHLFFEELPSGFCLQFHVRDAWRWNIFLLAIIAIS